MNSDRVIREFRDSDMVSLPTSWHMVVCDGVLIVHFHEGHIELRGLLFKHVVLRIAMKETYLFFPS